MKRQRRNLLIAVLAGLAGSACLAFFIWGQAQSVIAKEKELVQKYEGGTMQVLVAKRRIDAGTLLAERHFEVHEWPVIFTVEGTVHAGDKDQVLGKRSTSTILAGETLSKIRLSQQISALDRLKEGYSAVTIGTDDEHALGGEIIQGMRLTLMAGQSDGSVSMIAADVEVLSANTASSMAASAVEASESQESSWDSLGLGSSDESRGNSLSSGGSSRAESICWVTLSVPNTQVAQVLSASRASRIHLVLPGGSGPAALVPLEAPSEGL
jgi:Flp pilus assembly protein CpaB